MPDTHERNGADQSACGGNDPAHEHRPEPTFLEVLGQRADDVARDRVALAAAVTEEERRLGRDDVGRVAGDEAEPLPRDGLEEAPGARLDVRGAVQDRVEGREVERALVEVRGDDVVAVAGRKERLHSGTGSFAGAKGGYVARQRHREAGGDGTADFHLQLAT